jgi:serpin B
MKRTNLLLPILFIVSALASCHKGTNVQPNKGKDLTLNATQLQQASADNTFSLNLFQTVSADNANTNNLFISPLSVSIALGMTSNGAKGETLTAMQNTLDFKNYTQDQVNSYYNTLITELPELDPNTTLKIANSIWYRQSFNVLPQFIQTESTDYKANVQALDFGNSSSVNTINNWVSDQTSGKITKIVNSIDPGDMMILINAIYFKSSWASKFDPANTKKQSFIRADNSQVQTNFMRGSAMACNVSNNADANLLELPYSNKKYSMVIVMPNEGKSVNDIVSEMDSATWKNWTSRLGAFQADITMPKFQFSYSINLNSPLSTMGMGVAFSPLADFSNINGSGGLQITAVNHKAFVDVDESGTTAAAVTSVVIGVSAILNEQITIDHPFIFVIREMKTGLIVFTGIVNDPTQSGL